MSRRVSLPGADELFRTTGGTALQPSAPRRGPGGEVRVPAPAGDSDGAVGAEDAPASVPVRGGDGEGSEHVAADAESDGDQPRSRSAAAGAERAVAAGRQPQPQEGSATAGPRKRGRGSGRRPSGRERHDEKITVYVSAEELMDLEHARLVLRGEHGLAVDRGRIVREAVAVVLADLESRGDASILVRRLRGR
ncbi:hypothetical protein [Streptomyces europaeiscabiei]|uniref:hypothetical protein n=1 Tax=Streptomyces europaeiscabiei TaxID=146819 RepID=UPI0029B1C50B|nr:hypothetical protein [Streptomyces europaeiscabiei]MDX3715934.1 hypothetical protein [Streptomyces europaeiscabiei]MDX3864136.1 hypothetical protein [Streptomyces europaeiscabiei]MDX3870480.1 hypothetical protein [Streptomyces europaeiscabiei]